MTASFLYSGIGVLLWFLRGGQYLIEFLMKTVCWSEPAMRGRLFPSTRWSSSTGHHDDISHTCRPSRRSLGTHTPVWGPWPKINGNGNTWFCQIKTSSMPFIWPLNLVPVDQSPGPGLWSTGHDSGHYPFNVNSVLLRFYIPLTEFHIWQL